MKSIFLNSALAGIIFSVSALTNVATAGLITLDMSNVIGSTVSYSNSFSAGNVLDNQSGVITETNQSPGDIDGGYWLNPDNGTENAWLTIDLGGLFVIDFIELFNTHNGRHFDRGTGDFSIVASNSVTQTGDLAGIETTLINSTLLAESGALAGALTAQSFSSSNTNAFRYIQFQASSVAVGGSQCCGANVYGLNEIRVFESTSVPEPTSIATFSLALMGLAFRRFKKKS